MCKICCKDMEFFLEENKVSIFFDAKRRMYAIGMKNGTNAIQLIYYCPWCGTKLPKDLSDEWWDIIVDEYGIQDPDSDDADKVPEEFKTDEWWKKRGL